MDLTPIQPYQGIPNASSGRQYFRSELLHNYRQKQLEENHVLGLLWVIVILNSIRNPKKNRRIFICQHSTTFRRVLTVFREYHCTLIEVFGFQLGIEFSVEIIKFGSCYSYVVSEHGHDGVVEIFLKVAVYQTARALGQATDSLISETEFSRAAAFVPEIAASLSNDDLVYLYARYKQATEGPCNTPQPGLLQYRARLKWNAWKALGNLSAEEAKKEYLKKVSEVAPDWTSKTSTRISGPRVSRPMFPEEFVKGDADGHSASKPSMLIELVKDGNLEAVEEFIQKNPSSVYETDANGLTSLHWAVDRGFTKIVTALLDNGADIDAQDVDKQTPLHYACSCQHRDVASLLLDRGANTTLCDADGDLPYTQFLNS
ncbi:hypothetical protein Aperf_G00000101594 [Anoplocephala perfoliata]